MGNKRRGRRTKGQEGIVVDLDEERRARLFESPLGASEHEHFCTLHVNLDQRNRPGACCGDEVVDSDGLHCDASAAEGDAMIARV